MKKGFTLIELLAVIVILAIIALIATPIILNIVEDSKKSAIKNSAQLYVDGLQKRIASENLQREFNPSSCTVTNGSVSCDSQALAYTVDGQAPTSGTISFSNGVVTGYQLYIDGYTVTKSGSTLTTTKGEPTIEFNGTYVAGGQNDTYIGIAYLDPTDLSRTCTAQLAAQNVDSTTHLPTGVTSGCMKFYVYKDDGTNYSMILDHNTSGDLPWINQDDYIEAGGTQVDWDNYIKNNKGPVTANKRLATDTTGWSGSPRLISIDEIAQIVGADEAIGWDSTDEESGWFYLDGSGTTWDEWADNPGLNDETKSAYAWLYDYTNGCVDNGCNFEDNNQYPSPTLTSSSTQRIEGYWTSTARTGSDSDAWMVMGDGFIYDENVYYVPTMGIRPVITLPKSIFQ